MLYLLLVACEDPSAAPLGAATFESTHDNLAARIWFSSDVEGDGWVELQLDEEPVRRFSAASADGEQFEADVAGLVAGAEYRWRAVVSTADGERATPWGSWRTPAPPQNLPTAFATLAATESETLFLTTQVAPEARVVAMDALGRPLWWSEAGERQQIWQARLTADGQGVMQLIAPQDEGETGQSVLRYVPLFDGEGFELEAGWGHHDFVAVDEDSWAILQSERRTEDGIQLKGDRLVVIDSDGGERVVWSSFDWLERPVVDFLPESGPFDWTHANAVDYDAERDIFWMSLHELSMVVAIQGATGEPLGYFGGDEGDHTLTAGTEYRYQHGVAATATGFRVFDNGELGADSPRSRAVEYTVDFEAGTYAEVWSWAGDEQIFAPFLGNVGETPSGGLSVNWGAAGRQSELDADGELIGQVDLELGAVMSFSHPISRLGPTP